MLHLHEPIAPSLSMLALIVADGPIVATFHTVDPRSRTLSAFQPVLQPFLEKITARIAVSALARRVQVEHLGGDAVEIPNGVDVGVLRRRAPARRATRGAGGTIGFVGRFAEPRKGMAMLLDALRLLVARAARTCGCWWSARGDEDELRRAGRTRSPDRLVLLGQVDDATKARALRSVDVYCAPNTGGESFGMILTEAMAAGTAGGGQRSRRVPPGAATTARAGVLTPVGDAAALADGMRRAARGPGRRAAMAARAAARVGAYDWSVVAGQVLRVYETAIAANPRPGRRSRELDERLARRAAGRGGAAAARRGSP